MEQVVTDARTYAWPSVRTWSEEICARVTEGTLLWSDQYEIDRLQTQISHAHSASAHQPTSSELNNNNILSGVSDAVRLARAAPPCRAFQNGLCGEPTHHTLIAIYMYANIATQQNAFSFPIRKRSAGQSNIGHRLTPPLLRHRGLEINHSQLQE